MSVKHYVQRAGQLEESIGGWCPVYDIRGRGGLGYHQHSITGGMIRGNEGSDDEESETDEDSDEDSDENSDEDSDEESENDEDEYSDENLKKQIQDKKEINKLHKQLEEFKEVIDRNKKKLEDENKLLRHLSSNELRTIQENKIDKLQTYIAEQENKYDNKKVILEQMKNYKPRIDEEEVGELNKAVLKFKSELQPDTEKRFQFMEKRFQLVNELNFYDEQLKHLERSKRQKSMSENDIKREEQYILHYKKDVEDQIKVLDEKIKGWEEIKEKNRLNRELKKTMAEEKLKIHKDTLKAQFVNKEANLTPEELEKKEIRGERNFFSPLLEQTREYLIGFYELMNYIPEDELDLNQRGMIRVKTNINESIRKKYFSNGTYNPNTDAITNIPFQQKKDFIDKYRHLIDEYNLTAFIKVSVSSELYKIIESITSVLVSIESTEIYKDIRKYALDSMDEHQQMIQTFIQKLPHPVTLEEIKENAIELTDDILERMKQLKLGAGKTFEAFILDASNHWILQNFTNDNSTIINNDVNPIMNGLMTYSGKPLSDYLVYDLSSDLFDFELKCYGVFNKLFPSTMATSYFKMLELYADDKNKGIVLQGTKLMGNWSSTPMFYKDASGNMKLYNTYVYAQDLPRFNQTSNGFWLNHKMQNGHRVEVFGKDVYIIYQFIEGIYAYNLNADPIYDDNGQWKDAIQTNIKRKAVSVRLKRPIHQLPTHTHNGEILYTIDIDIVGPTSYKTAPDFHGADSIFIDPSKLVKIF